MATNPLTRQAFGDQDPYTRPANSFGDAAASFADSAVQRVNTGASSGPLSKLASSAQTRLAAPIASAGNESASAAPSKQPEGWTAFTNRMIAMDRGQPAAKPSPTTVGQPAGSGQSLLSAAGIGSNPGGQAKQFQSPMVSHSGNDWTAHENLRRLKMDANSLVHQSAWAPKGAGEAAANAYNKASLIDHAAMTGGQAQASLATMQQNAGLLKEGMQQTGENARRSLADMAGLQRENIQQEGAVRRQSLADVANMDRTLVEQSGANARTSMEEQGKGIIAAMQAQAAARKAPEGYRFTADGSRMEVIPGGPSDINAPGGGKPLNDTQSKSLQFGARMQTASEGLDDLASEGIYEPGRMHRALGSTALTNWTQSDGQQKVEQSQRDFINAVLRRESGAAIADSEFENARKQYFPQMGDSAEVIEQKRRNREISTNGILAEVPNARQRLAQVIPPKAVEQAALTQPPASSAQRIESQEAFAQLASGATFVAPDGTVRIKP